MTVWVAVLIAALVLSILAGLRVADAVFGPRPRRPVATAPAGQQGSAAAPPAGSDSGAESGAPAARPAAGQAPGNGAGGLAPQPGREPARAQVAFRILPAGEIRVGQEITLFDESVIPPGDAATGYEWTVTTPDAAAPPERLVGPQVTFTPKRPGPYRVRLTVLFRRAGSLQSQEVAFSAAPAAPAGPAPRPAAVRQTVGPLTIWKEGGRTYFMLLSKELGIAERGLVNQLTVDFWFGANERSRFGPGTYQTDTPLILVPADVEIYAVQLSGILPNGKTLSGTYSFRP